MEILIDGARDLIESMDLNSVNVNNINYYNNKSPDVIATPDHLRGASKGQDHRQGLRRQVQRETGGLPLPHT